VKFDIIIYILKPDVPLRIKWKCTWTPGWKPMPPLC